MLNLKNVEPSPLFSRNQALWVECEQNTSKTPHLSPKTIKNKKISKVISHIPCFPN